MSASTESVGRGPRLPRGWGCFSHVLREGRTPGGFAATIMGRSTPRASAQRGASMSIRRIGFNPFVQTANLIHAQRRVEAVEKHIGAEDTELKSEEDVL